MIRYALPDIIKHLSFNIQFSRMMQSAPELFYDDVKAECIYGNFPECIMNGGRVMQGKPYTADQVNSVFDAIEDAGMAIRLTFTNMLIRQEHYEDQYSNMILKAAEGRNAQVIVYSDDLGNYISTRYHLKLILSTSRALKDVEELNQKLEHYDMVVLNYNHNQDDSFLKQVTDPSRLEVMVNELCKPNCPDRQKHYESDSLFQLEHKLSSFRCSGEREGLGYTTRMGKYKHILSNDDIRRLNKSYGISHFKLTGRGCPEDHYLETYLYYLVKPEYHNVVVKIIKK